jgi:hypothetical protein
MLIPRSGEKAGNDSHGSQNIRGRLGALQKDRRGHSLEPTLARTEGHGLGIEVASLCSSTTKADCQEATECWLWRAFSLTRRSPTIRTASQLSVGEPQRAAACNLAIQL